MWSMASWAQRSVVSSKFLTVVASPLLHVCCDDQVSEWLGELGCWSAYNGTLLVSRGYSVCSCVSALVADHVGRDHRGDAGMPEHLQAPRSRDVTVG